MVHAKPRLSPWSRLLLVQRVAAGRPAAHVAAEMGVSRATAYKWLARYRAEGSAGLLDRSSRPRVVSDPHRSGRWRRRSWRCAGTAGSARLGSPGSSGSTPRRCTGCWSGTRCRGCPGWTGPPARSSAATNAPGPASWSTSTSRSSARSGAGGGWRARAASSPPPPLSSTPADGSATTTCTAPSTTTPGWPTPRSTPTRRPRPAPGSCAGPPPGSPSHGIDRIERVMTDNAFAYRRCQRLAQALADLGAEPASPAATGHRPTARPNGSTAPCSRSGPTPELFDSSAATSRSLARLPAHLQPSPSPHRARREAPDQPRHRQRPHGALQLDARTFRRVVRSRPGALRDWGVLLLVNVRTDTHGDQAIGETVQELSRLPHAVPRDLRRLTPQGVARQTPGSQTRCRALSSPSPPPRRQIYSVTGKRAKAQSRSQSGMYRIPLLLFGPRSKTISHAPLVVEQRTR